MFFQKKNILVISLSLFLSLTLLFPSLVQLSHVFETHEHKFCGDYSNHFHEKEHQCHIQDFHFSSFHFIPFSTSSVTAHKISVPKTEYYTIPFLSQKPSQFHKRGPPVNS